MRGQDKISGWVKPKTRQWLAAIAPDIDRTADRIMEQCDQLASCSDDDSKLTRTFCSPAMKSAHQLTNDWMCEAGLNVRLDEATNLIGRKPSGNTQGDQVLLVGSHLDSVVNAGRYDGPLGVLLGVGLAGLLHRCEIQLPFAVDVIGFADEEGVRYDTAYLGSRAIAGVFEEGLLDRRDADGIPMRQAISDFGGNPDSLSGCKYETESLLGYIEVHIEQGPLLESLDRPLGVVSAIAGQTRASVRFSGRSGHAGTTPMNRRQDALAAAAQFINRVEEIGLDTIGLVATVGKISVTPNAINVIPDEACLSLDIRHAEEAVRDRSLNRVLDAGRQIAELRNVEFGVDGCESFPAVPMDAGLRGRLTTALTKAGHESLEIVSGAGHDAVYMSHIAPVAMLFVRCRGGLSHHPDESVTVEDVASALRALVQFVLNFADDQNGSS